MNSVPLQNTILFRNLKTFPRGNNGQIGFFIALNPNQVHLKQCENILETVYLVHLMLKLV